MLYVASNKLNETVLMSHTPMLSGLLLLSVDLPKEVMLQLKTAA